MTNQASEINKLESFFEEIIQQMDRQFTSHEFFLKLAHVHQNEYVAALAGYNAKPFKELHSEIVKRLRKLDGNLISLQKTDYPSRDIFGIASTTALWRKK